MFELQPWAAGTRISPVTDANGKVLTKHRAGSQPGKKQEKAGWVMREHRQDGLA